MSPPPGHLWQDLSTVSHCLTGTRTTKAGKESPSCCFLGLLIYKAPYHGQSVPCPVLGAPQTTLEGFHHVSSIAARSLTLPEPHLALEQPQEPQHSKTKQEETREMSPPHTSSHAGLAPH